MADFVLEKDSPDMDGKESSNPSLDTLSQMEEDDAIGLKPPRFATGGLTTPRHNMDTSSSHQPSSLPSTPTPAARATRHYKKDSMYVLDLYTLTFDEDETVEDVETVAHEVAASMAHQPLSMMSFSNASGVSSGPMSLGSNYNGGATSQNHPTLPSLETNLHKILARKIQDSEEV